MKTGSDLDTFMTPLHYISLSGVGAQDGADS